jgi:pyruvate-formate lyase
MNMHEKLTPQQKADLKKLYEMNPDFYRRSQADKKKYGEKRLIEMNQKLMRDLEKEAEKRKEAIEKMNEDEIRKIIENEGKSILKGRHSVFIENNPLKND